MSTHKTMIINTNQILNVFLCYMLLSTLVISILFYFVPDFNWIFLKDGALLLMIFVGLMIRYDNLRIKVFYYLIPLVFVLLLSYALSSANSYAKIASVRQIIIPFAIIIMGVLFGLSRDRGVSLKRFFLYFMFFLIVFGFFERFYNLWAIVDLRPYFNFKSIPVHSSGYPYFFIEPISISGFEEVANGIPRMVSTLLDPINWGHTLVFVISMLMFDKDIQLKVITRKLLLFFAVVALVLTFSKGAFLQLILVVAFLNPSINIIYRVMLSIVLMPLVYLFSIYHAGFWVHLNGFLGSISSLTWMGHGLGMVGNYSVMFNPSGVTLEMAIGDSFWGAILGQVGLLGFIVWILTLFLMTKEVAPNNYIYRTFWALIFVSALSENSFNMMSVFVPGIFLGVAIANNRYVVGRMYLRPCDGKCR